MPKIEIKQGDFDLGTSKHTGVQVGYGVRVWADGVELEDLTSVHVDADVDSIVTVRVNQQVTHGWSFTHDRALLQLWGFLTPNGYKVRAKKLEDGTVEYSAVPLSFEEVQEVNS